MFTLAARLSVACVFLTYSLPTFAQSVEWWADGEGSQKVLATSQGVYTVGFFRSDDVPKGVLSKYSPDGRLLWRRFDEWPDRSIYIDVAADENGVYVLGSRTLPDVSTRYSRGIKTGVLRRYDHDGSVAWTFSDYPDNPKGFAIANMYPAEIVVNEEGVFVLGGRYGHQPYLRRFDFDGNLVWLRLLSEGKLFAAELAEGDGMLFAASNGLVGGVTHVYSLDGNFIQLVFSGKVLSDGLVYSDGAVFACSQYQNVATLRKIDLDSGDVWSISFGKNDIGGCALTTDGDELIVATNNSPRNGRARRSGPTVRRYDSDGALLDAWEFPSLDVVPSSVSLLDDALYVAGYVRADFSKFVARLSAAPTLPPAAAVVETGGASSGVAFLEHHYGAGPVTAKVKSVDGSYNKTLAFSDDLRPVDFFTAGDLSGNGVDDLAVLSRDPARLEVVDGANGASLVTIDLPQWMEPVAAVASARGGDPVLAVLMQHPEKHHILVEEFDFATGAKLASIPYNPLYRAQDLLAAGEIEGERFYAVLAVPERTTGPAKIEVRNTGLSGVRHAWLGAGYSPVAAVSLGVGGGSKQVAVLRRNAQQGWTDVAIVDVLEGDILGTLPFDGQLVPTGMVFSDDANGDLSQQATVAGILADGVNARAQTRELAAGTLLHNVWLSPETPVQDLVYLGPGSGAATPAIGLLIRDNVAANRYQVVLVDLVTGAKTETLDVEF